MAVLVVVEMEMMAWVMRVRKGVAATCRSCGTTTQFSCCCCRNSGGGGSGGGYCCRRCLLLFVIDVSLSCGGGERCSLKIS